MLVYGIISPHPPIILPDVGGDDRPKVQDTIAALEHAVTDLAKAKPDKLIVIAPHEGHGFAVPEYYLGQQLAANLPVEHILVTEPSYEYYADYGREVGRQLQAGQERVAIVASGDLSHVLAADGPYGFNPAGPKLDQAILEAVRAGDVPALLAIDPTVRDDGAECGLRSIIFLLAASAGAGRTCSPKVLSYEAPFGVGYLVATLDPAPTHPAPGRQSAAPAGAGIGPAALKLARTAIAHFLETGHILTPPKSLPAALNQPSAGFVSLHEAGGELRGCIGTVTPVQPTLAAEIIANAIAAATTDDRFAPVTAAELGRLRLSVDILSEPASVPDPGQLDPQRYGVIVTAADGRRGVLLPRLEGVTTAAEQIAISRDKAGIGPAEPVELQRFETERFEESNLN